MSSMNFIHLTEQKLDVNEISERVTDESCGAISLFVGTTRDNFEDKKVNVLEFSKNTSFFSDIVGYFRRSPHILL